MAILANTARVLGDAHAALLRQEKVLAAELQRVRSAIKAIEPLLAATGGKDVSRTASPGSGSGVDPELRGRSYAEAVELILREHGSPLHVNQIIKRLQKRGYRAEMESAKLKNNLIGSISRKARHGKIFVADGKGVYGLRDWEGTSERDPSQIAAPIGPPKPIDAIIRAVMEGPGRSSTDIANELADRVATESSDPRKMLLTMIGQQVSAGRLWRDEKGGLRLATEET